MGVYAVRARRRTLNRPQLGDASDLGFSLDDVSTKIQSALSSFANRTAQFQKQAQNVAAAINKVGGLAVTTSNAATGAAAGAYAGSKVPTSGADAVTKVKAFLDTVPKPILYGGAGIIGLALLKKLR